MTESTLVVGAAQLDRQSDWELGLAQVSISGQYKFQTLLIDRGFAQSSSNLGHPAVSTHIDQTVATTNSEVIA